MRDLISQNDPESWVWEQRDRYESTSTLRYRGSELRVVASYSCTDYQSVAHLFGKRDGAKETPIGEPLWRDTLDEALLAGKIMAMKLVDASPRVPRAASEGT